MLNKGGVINMKSIICYCIIPITTCLLNAQSSVVFDVNTHIEVGAGADICATNIIVNGTFLGDGTFCNSPLPVELSSFNASVNNNTVLLMWVTETETNNYGFEIERQILKQVQNDNNNWETIGFVEGYGNSNSPKSYSFTDGNPVGGNKFYYRLKQINNDGQFKYSNIVEVNLTPTEFSLYQNYPNPFNPNTTIKYQVPKECKVSIKIYDLLGAEIIELLNEKREPGIYEIEFNAASLPSGVYLYKLTDGNSAHSKKMLLLK